MCKAEVNFCHLGCPDSCTSLFHCAARFPLTKFDPYLYLSIWATSSFTIFHWQSAVRPHVNDKLRRRSPQNWFSLYVRNGAWSFWSSVSKVLPLNLGLGSRSVREGSRWLSGEAFGRARLVCGFERVMKWLGKSRKFFSFELVSSRFFCPCVGG